MSSFLHGVVWMSGILTSLGIGVIFVVLAYPYIERLEIVYDVKQKIFSGEPKSVRPPPMEEVSFDEIKPEVKDPIPEREVFYVKNIEELYRIVESANRSKTPTEVVLSPGEYVLKETIYIQTDWFYIRSLEDNADTTQIKGNGMFGNVGNLFRISGNHFHLRALTLSDASSHLIQIAGEAAASYPIIEDSVFVDSKEQFIKISFNPNTPSKYSIGGIIRNCYFYFSRGIAPHYYTGGIDGHGVRHWLIENNLFADIASPAQHIAEHAIHLWNNSAFNLVRGNIIIDSDRGIGFGMGRPQHPNVIYGNLAGEMHNNFIYQSVNEHPFSDAAIVLESSPKTKITSNFSYFEHDYPRAIEYRFRSTVDVVIENNRVNRRIASRDNGNAIVENNSEIFRKEAFMEQLLEHARDTGLLVRYPEFFEKLDSYSKNSQKTENIKG